MADSPSFTTLAPGFDFLQSLVKNAGAAMPSMGQWVAPTLNPEELEKRIGELKTVQFWLEQNARLLGATIQALEVQRMTLSTLKTMNVQFGDLRDAMKIRMPTLTPGVPKPATESPEEEAPAAPTEATDTPEADGAKPGVVDPMQWWGALTKQFTELATAAMKTAATNEAAVASASASATQKRAVAPKAAPRKAAAKRKSPARKRAAPAHP